MTDCVYTFVEKCIYYLTNLSRYLPQLPYTDMVFLDNNIYVIYTNVHVYINLYKVVSNTDLMGCVIDFLLSLSLSDWFFYLL